MNFLGLIKELGPHDIQPLVDLVQRAAKSQWTQEIDFFQAIAPGRPGKVIYVVDNLTPEKLKRGSGFKEFQNGQIHVDRRSGFSHFAPILLPWIKENLFKHYPSTQFFKVQLTSLGPGETIPPHADGRILEYAHRVHVPLVSNSKVVFTIDNQQFLLEPGKVYEINNTKTHSVYNGGTDDRIHLIVDLMPIQTAQVIHQWDREGL